MALNDETRDAGSPRSDVKSEIARMLIDAMERGDTPWQKPWHAQALRPTNLASGNGYKGINRLLLAMSGRDDPRWMTYQQAQANRWQVRRGEKGMAIVKLVELSPRDAAQMDASGAGVAEQGAEGPRRAFALRRYTVFNAQQIDGVPELETPPPLDFDPVERAESVMAALQEKTGLIVVHKGARACYIPSLDEVRLPPKRKFDSVYDYYSTAMHEAAHSSLHEKRMNRKEVLSKKWGDEAYAMEELRAEICSAILAAETGVPMSQAHIDNHAAYLQSWLKVVAADPMAIFSAARDAERMASYMLDLEKQRTAIGQHQEWIEEYDNARRA